MRGYYETGPKIVCIHDGKSVAVCPCESMCYCRTLVCSRLEDEFLDALQRQSDGLLRDLAREVVKLRKEVRRLQSGKTEAKVRDRMSKRVKA